MTDLRKAAELALKALESCSEEEDYDGEWFNSYDEDLVIEAKEVLRQALAQPDEVLAEREECAKLCDEMPLRSFPSRASDCAAAIRARGEK